MKNILYAALLGAAVGAGAALGSEIYRLLVPEPKSNLSDDATKPAPATE